eukprot:TRINITY_DN14028_c0_g1_i1.p1 TRINITY_DN14028_c0_g1~~TRINITY_DN14028_c0_g1_i1.p1  ORF type:complete len:210 (+),score=56.18 TRINITY_DN14028_c0_g1_i1:58-687(+)
MGERTDNPAQKMGKFLKKTYNNTSSRVSRISIPIPILKRETRDDPLEISREDSKAGIQKTPKKERRKTLEKPKPDPFDYEEQLSVINEQLRDCELKTSELQHKKIVLQHKALENWHTERTLLQEELEVWKRNYKEEYRANKALRKEMEVLQYKVKLQEEFDTVENKTLEDLEEILKHREEMVREARETVDRLRATQARAPQPPVDDIRR